MTENQVFSLVQALRAMVTNNYNRGDWCYLPGPGDQNAVVKMNISLGQVVGNGNKLSRLLACELLSTLFGWNSGTTAEALLRVYEDLKKKLGRGSAERAFAEIRKDAKTAWGLGSTKDLWLAELYALIEWLEQHNGVLALQVIAQNPKAWMQRLRRLDKVTRPNVVNAPAPDHLTDFDLSVVATPEELWGELPF